MMAKFLKYFRRPQTIRTVGKPFEQPKEPLLLLPHQRCRHSIRPVREVAIAAPRTSLQEQPAPFLEFLGYLSGEVNPAGQYLYQS